VNVAAVSDGKAYTNNQVNGLRKCRLLCGKLQAKDTKAEKHFLVKPSLKKSRFASNINHFIDRSIVMKVKDTGRVSLSKI